MVLPGRPVLGPAGGQAVVLSVRSRAIDAELAESLEDVKKGRIHGPFDTMEEVARSFRETGKRLRGKTKTKYHLNPAHFPSWNVGQETDWRPSEASLVS